MHYPPPPPPHDLSVIKLHNKEREVQSNISTMATLGSEESGRCKEVAVMGRQGCNMTIFLGE